MIRGLVAVVCVWAAITLLQAPIAEPQKQAERVPKSPLDLAVPGQPIAGIPHDKALEIYQRHAEELRKLPSAVSVSFVAGGLMVATVKPELLPATVEGLPVIPVPPIDPKAAATINDDLAFLPSPPPEPYPLPERPEVKTPTLEPCPPGASRSSPEGRCRHTNQNTIPALPEPNLLPPPPGVIVLKPGKVREHAEKCPVDFNEVEGYGGWRFCVDPQNPQQIPPLWSPPIANIPFEEVWAIHNRHVSELSKLPGVESVGLEEDGIHIVTSNPEVVPKAVEGVPIIIHPATGQKIGPANHTVNTPVRPLHGALAMGQEGLGVLTGIGLSQGHPWLIFPAHLLETCSISPPCSLSSTPLNSCQHYPLPGQTIPIVVQPPVGSPALVGFTQRWTQLSGLATNDVAAAFMDSDTGEDNASLAADRQVHTTTPIPFSGTLAPEPIPLNTRVTMRGALFSPHSIPLIVKAIGVTITNVEQCSGNPYNLNNQVRYGKDPLSPYFMEKGDSGAPVFDAAGRMISMMNWCSLTADGSLCGCVIPQGQSTCELRAGGTPAGVIRDTLRFDRWYGTASVQDQTVGIFKPSLAQWFIDNGNGRYDGCGSPPSAEVTKDKDGCFVYGTPGNVNIPLTGDWDGDVNKTVTVGVYRTDTNPQRFELSNSNTSAQIDRIFYTGSPAFGFLPVVGKWVGMNTATKVGIFKPSDGSWYLDNGDYSVASTGCATGDICFNTASWTRPGDKPIAGDWDGNGEVTIGVFRPSESRFYLSNKRQPTGADWIINAGDPTNGFLPAIGDWTGTNIFGVNGTKLGVFKPSTGGWYLVSQLGSPTSCATDICSGPFGVSGDQPVAFGPSTIRAN